MTLIPVNEELDGGMGRSGRRLVIAINLYERKEGRMKDLSLEREGGERRRNRFMEGEDPSWIRKRKEKEREGREHVHDPEGGCC